MSITIKVFYEKTNGPPEIRRFPLNNGGADCFAYISAKIEQFFRVNSQNVQLFWIDSDGDRVAFSSSEEMRDALDYVTDGVFRVYIPEVKKTATTTNTSDAQTQSKPRNGERPRQRPSSNQNPLLRPLHVGVVCDGCEGEVRGQRFKCSTCPDYDLCSECERKGLHNKHDMYIVEPPAEIPNLDEMKRNLTATRSADYLNNIGATIASFLDPFGVDVTYDIVPKPAGSEGPFTCHRTRNCTRGPGLSAHKTACPKQPAAPEPPVEKPAAEKETNAPTPMETNQDQQPESAGAQNSDAHITNEATEENDDSVMENWTIVPDDCSEVPVCPPGVNAPEPPTAPAAEPTQQPSQNNNSQNSNLSAQGTGGIYPNLRLQQSLDQMLSMGFTNTDGWLSNLLMEYNCDIGLTLDAIKARATQQLDSLKI